MTPCARRAGAARRTARCTKCRRSGWAPRCWRRCATATGSTPRTVDDIIFGCVDPVGEAGAVIPRAAAFEAGYSDKAPGMQISRFCASGLDAINFGAAKIVQGSDDIVIAGGVESMSRVGMGMSGGAWFMDPSVGLPGWFVPQGISADLIATKYGFSRDDVDAYAVESQKRAAKAWDEGCFKNSVIPIKDQNGLTILDRDEHMRPEHRHAVAGGAQSLLRRCPAKWAASTPSAVQKHPEIEEVNHVHHAGNSSGIVDGAAARAARLEEGRQDARHEAARAHPRLRQHRLRAGADADRPGRRDREAA